MSLNDSLANVLSDIFNAEKVGKPEVVTKPHSKLIENILNLMKDLGYIGDFEVIDDGKGKIIKINLLGRINKCAVIKPRYSVQKVEFKKFEKRYLPASGFGILIVSTVQGIMTHEKANENGLGGVLLAYCY